MRLAIRFVSVCALLKILGVGSYADGAVSLSFTNGTATPTSTTVIRGTTFSFTVDLTSTTSASNDQVTAVDYFLAGSASNIFTINSRNTTTDGTAFAGTYTTDSGAVASGNNPTLNISASPNFRNGADLGGTQPNITDPPVSNTTVVVADYSVLIAANTPIGVYTLTTFSQPGTGYEGPSPTFTEETFASQGIYTVTVAAVPEPSTVGLVVVVGAVLALRRRRHA